MNPKIQEQIELLQKKGFVITDQEKVFGYLEKVGYHRLLPYFKNAPGDIERVIGYYIFDKRLRLLCLDMLEVIENAIKSIIINYLSTDVSDKIRYNKDLIYNEKAISIRLEFIKNKIIERKTNDPLVKSYFEQNETEDLPDYIFFDKLTFGEITKVFKDLKLEYKKIIAEYFGINGFMFEDRIFSLKYFRNLCSHYENIFNKKMTISIRSRLIKEYIGNQNTFVTYFAILSIFNKLLIPNFDRRNKVIELMKKFNISRTEIGAQKNLPSELESEAWEVLLNRLYEKHIKKSNLFENKDKEKVF